MSKTSVLERHIEFKKTSVKAKAKLQDIERYLKLFLDFTSKPLAKFNGDDLNLFLNSLTDKYSIRTINDIKVYIKVFVKWYFKNWPSKFSNLDKSCKQQEPEEAYDAEQMISFEDFEKIVKAENNLMWKTYWLVMFYGGFRPSEACRLKWDNIYFEKEGVIIKILTTKTKRKFYKSLTKDASQMLKELKNQSSSEFVFPSPLNKDDCIRARTVCQRLKRLSKKALGKEVVPYILRHSIATILYSDDERKDDNTANQLGHSKSMKSTYEHLDEHKLKAQARKLWIKTKDLSPEKKQELERKLKLQGEKIFKLEKVFGKIKPTLEFYNKMFSQTPKEMAK